MITSIKSSKTLTIEIVSNGWIVRPYPGYAPMWLLDNFQIVPKDPIYRVQELEKKRWLTSAKKVQRLTDPPPADKTRF